MLAAEIRNLMERLDKAEESCDGDAIECAEEQCAAMLYRVVDIVENYEFLATHVAYMQVDFDWGGRDKIYNDSKNFNAFHEVVTESLEQNKPSEDEDDE
jgi:hypothetical protein